MQNICKTCAKYAQNMFKPEYVERQYSATVLWSLGGIHTAVTFVDAVRTVGKTVACNVGWISNSVLMLTEYWWEDERAREITDPFVPVAEPDIRLGRN